MLTIEKTSVYGFEEAIRGMRNPMNSWEKSDSKYNVKSSDTGMFLGANDKRLMKKLADNGPVHAKYRRMITVYMDVTAPLYWWKEFDTYKVGTVANSCSTMHKIHAKEFTLNDFSYEHLSDTSLVILEEVIKEMNFWRNEFVNGVEKGNKQFWWQMIQLLPTSYNQKRTIMLNYEVLTNIYESRRNHKLDEWHTFCDWIESLPYNFLITGKERGICED